MPNGKFLFIIGIFAVLGAAVLFFVGESDRPASPPKSSGPDSPIEAVTILYPYEGAVFPPESIPPMFRWSSDSKTVDSWRVLVDFGKEELRGKGIREKSWTPDNTTWSMIKKSSVKQPRTVTIQGVAADGKTVVASGQVSLVTSTDPVGAPLFYREVPLPFIDAVKDPARIRWRFGTVDSAEQPKVVLENLPVCGNCHSFSADGRVLGMDVDYANDKGSYVIIETAKQMTLDKSKVITWSSFEKEDKQPTFGLLSQVSPDGRFVVSTVKDRSVFVPKDDITFSQLFFPLKGILAFYDREKKTITALPGADDPAYVHSNPTWSPDGKYIVFARSRAYELKMLKDKTTALLTPDECEEFLSGGKTFRFDLYRIPFNGGKGGTAEPVPGASNNGKSNFFAKYSPDGKWIVFCQANSFMLLQPDSTLYIIPSDGGDAKALDANLRRMNSWHSFSPNSRWLVFASKADTPYTQLFLTHIDDQGKSAPPIVLSHFSATDRAANIPEFVNLAPDAVGKIQEAFVDDQSYMRAALENVKAGDMSGAAELYRKALAENKDNVEAMVFLGGILGDMGEYQEAREYLLRAVKRSPKDGAAYYNLGNISAKEMRYDEALVSWEKAIKLAPDNLKASNNQAAVLLAQGRIDDAVKTLKKAASANPERAEARRNLGNFFERIGRHEDAVREWKEAVRLAPLSGEFDIETECKSRLTPG
jgi:Flp pilus assembly protein TadD/roadblock/LC7 domain-containing protein